jgi:hypothetical protein
MKKRIDIGDKIVLAYIIFLVLVVISLVAFILEIYLYFIPKILISEVYSLPINSNAYPFLLQALIIVAGVILGFLGTILVEIQKQLKRYKEIMKNQVWKSITIFALLLLGIFTTILMIVSISFSINGIIYYGVVNTYITTQIDGGIIPIIGTNGIVMLINSTYFTVNNNTIPTYISQRYNYLTHSTKIAIWTMFLGFTIWILLEIIFILIVFSPLDLIKSLFNKLIYIFKSRRKVEIQDGKLDGSN